MHIVRAVLLIEERGGVDARPDGQQLTPLTRELAIDIVWAASRIDDRIEHIAAHLDPPHMHIGVFCLAHCLRCAKKSVHELIARAIKSSPLLARASIAVSFD
jgi:hypothetical protein